MNTGEPRTATAAASDADESIVSLDGSSSWAGESPIEGGAATNMATSKFASSVTSVVPSANVVVAELASAKLPCPDVFLQYANL